MLVHCLYQAIIDTLWDEVSRKSCFTRAREFANLSIVIVDLDVGLKGLGISMLVLFVDTIQGLVSFLTDLAILRLYQRDIVPWLNCTSCPWSSFTIGKTISALSKISKVSPAAAKISPAPANNSSSFEKDMLFGFEQFIKVMSISFQGRDFFQEVGILLFGDLHKFWFVEGKGLP